MMFKKRDYAADSGIGNENIIREEGNNQNKQNEFGEYEQYSRDEIVSMWQRDAQQLKVLVPDFDLAEAVKNNIFKNALTSGKTVFEAYRETINEPKREPREEISQNARSARRGTGGTAHNPAKLSSQDFKKYIDSIRNG